MRIAVALPALPRTSMLRAALTESIAALVAQGHEIEGFAEDPRDHGDDRFRVFHYLRLAERHDARAFDSGLYPLGRDWRPYESSLLAMFRLPGVVWVLDPVPHHLAVGGLAMRGWWDEYRGLLERAFGDQQGALLAMTVAAGWAVRSTYRRFDPTSTMLAGQRRICAATTEIAAALAGGGVEAPVVPVPTPSLRSTDAPRARCRRILVLAFHYGWPEPVLQSLARLLEADPGLEFRVVVPELLQLIAIGPRARAMGLEGRITWLPPEEGVLGPLIDEVDLVAHLRDDPTAGEQALIDVALSRGMPVMQLRAPGVTVLPENVAWSVEPGRSLGPSFEGGVLTLVRDDALYRALAAGAKQFAAGRPVAADTAQQLAPLLRGAGGSQLVRPPVSAPGWQRLRARMYDAVTPAGSGPGTRRRFESIADGIMPSRDQQPDGAR